MLVLNNQSPADVDLYFATFSEPVGLLLLLAFLIGVSLCLLFGGSVMLYQRSKMSRLQKQYNLSQEELQNLRRMMVRDQEQ